MLKLKSTTNPNRGRSVTGNEYFTAGIATLGPCYMFLRGGGGGGGVHPDFCIKLDFGIAFDQKTRARDQNVEEIEDSGRPWGKPRPYLVHFWLNRANANHLNMSKTKLWVLYL